MARTDAIVLGAGIVGVSAALHLAKRGLTVALVDRRGAGEETSYGNAGVIEGNTLFAHAFPKGLGALLRIALKRRERAGELTLRPFVSGKYDLYAIIIGAIAWALITFKLHELLIGVAPIVM